MDAAAAALLTKTQYSRKLAFLGNIISIISYFSVRNAWLVHEDGALAQHMQNEECKFLTS